MKPIQVRRTRHAAHSWRSRDELISDVLLWTSSHGRAKAGQQAQSSIQQLYEDSGYSPGDLPEAMNDREGWREKVRDIRADSTTRWWWWWWLSIKKGILYHSFLSESFFLIDPIQRFTHGIFHVHNSLTSIRYHFNYFLGKRSILKWKYNVLIQNTNIF